MATTGFYTCGVVFVLLPRVSAGAEGGEGAGKETHSQKHLKTSSAVCLDVMKCDEI